MVLIPASFTSTSFTSTSVSPRERSVRDSSVPQLCELFALEGIPYAFPLLQPTGIAAHALVAPGFQDPTCHSTRGAGRAGVVEDYLVAGVKHLERFLHRADPQRAGDVFCPVFPLAQGHNELEVVLPVELLLQLLYVDEIHFGHSGSSFQDDPAIRRALVQGSRGLGPTSSSAIVCSPLPSGFLPSSKSAALSALASAAATATSITIR